VSATAGVPLAIVNTALVTSVGLDAPTTCAALRGKLTNPVQTRFVGHDGERLMGHEVSLNEPLRGLPRLVAMASMAIEEALRGIPPTDWPRLPILLCVSEKDRPGRTEGIDEQLFLDVQSVLDARFDERSSVVALGRVGMAVALSHARTLLQQPGTQRVLVVAVDSLLSWPTLSHYDSHHRLLTSSNSNGFMPGEG
jgi:3-oxoacyl-[acyl-carrier-protein] synthase-1